MTVFFWENSEGGIKRRPPNSYSHKSKIGGITGNIWRNKKIEHHNKTILFGMKPMFFNFIILILMCSIFFFLYPMKIPLIFWENAFKRKHHLNLGLKSASVCKSCLFWQPYLKLWGGNFENKFSWKWSPRKTRGHTSVLATTSATVRWLWINSRSGSLLTIITSWDSTATVL